MNEASAQTAPSRLAPVLLMVLVLAVGSWWIWQARPQSGPGDAGDYELSVVGPAGPWWNGTAQVGLGATVLDATSAAAAAGNFSLKVDYQALGAYVRGIGPYAETASGGWNYCIDGGAGYQWVGMAADQRHLHHGERIQWRWAEGGSEVC